MKSEMKTRIGSVLLLIGLGADIVAIYLSFKMDQALIVMNAARLGPYTRADDPFIFWMIIAFHIALAAGIIAVLNELKKNRSDGFLQK